MEGGRPKEDLKAWSPGQESLFSEFQSNANGNARFKQKRTDGQIGPAYNLLMTVIAKTVQLVLVYLNFYFSDEESQIVCI
jgi:hypothetical protein